MSLCLKRHKDKLRARKYRRQFGFDILNMYNRFLRLSDPLRYKNYEKVRYTRHKHTRRLQNKIWLKSHPNYYLVRYWRHPERERAKTALRRAQKLIPVFDSKKVAQKFKELAQENFCYWCSKPFTITRKQEIDHIIPLARGGLHSPENLVASCKACNLSKGSKLYWEWDKELAS